MKIQDFHQTNTYELTNFMLILSKLMQSQVISSDEAASWRFSSFEDFVFIFCLLSLNNTLQLFRPCNVTILHISNVNAMFVLYCEWVVLLAWRHPPQTFPPKSWFGVWQIGIRAIDYSKLVNILNKRNTKFTTIVTKAGTTSEQRNDY